jgi:hypothetical protein
MLDLASESDEPSIRSAAIQAGLLWLCPNCDEYNRSYEPSCTECGTCQPRSAAVLAQHAGTEVAPHVVVAIVRLTAVRTFLRRPAIAGQSDRTDDFEFVAACLDGRCGPVAKDTAQGALTGAIDMGHDDDATRVADTIIADITAAGPIAPDGLDPASGLTS